MTYPLSLGYNRSRMFYWLSYFTKTSLITPLSVYRALASPLHSKISASILSFTLYQIVRNFTCNYLTQPILENAYLLIGITFTSIRNMTKRAYPFTNPPNFTLSLTFPWIICNALMYPSHTILTARDYSFIKFHSILQDTSIITLAYL